MKEVVLKCFVISMIAMQKFPVIESDKGVGDLVIQIIAGNFTQSFKPFMIFVILALTEFGLGS